MAGYPERGPASSSNSAARERPRAGTAVHFRDFGGCTIVNVFNDGSADINIPGWLGSERVPQGQWKLKQAAQPRDDAVVLEPETCILSDVERRELEEMERQRFRDETDKAMEALLNEHPEQDSSQGNAWLSQKQLRGARNHQVWLHVYDLDPLIAKVNDYALSAIGMGAFHCGVEVSGDEWFFASGDSSESGVLYMPPKSHQVHVFKESIDMGKTPLTEDEVKKIIAAAMEAWPSDSYHIVNRNCIHFCEHLCQKLRVPAPFPSWVRAAPDAGSNSFLKPIADLGWRWFQYYHSEPAPVDQARSQESISSLGLSGCCAQVRKKPSEKALFSENNQ